MKHIPTKHLDLLVAAATLLRMLCLNAQLAASSPAHAASEIPANIDFTFNVDFPVCPDLRNIAIQRDGKILLSGDALFLSGQQVPLMRLDFHGAVDRSFRPEVQHPVHQMWGLADGRILLLDADSPRPKRLLTSGAMDPAFVPSAEILKQFDWANITPQDDGKILLWNSSSFRRLNEDGTADGTFNQNAERVLTERSVEAPERSFLKILPQADGNLLIWARNDLFRLRTDGTLDWTSSARSPGLWDFLPVSNGTLLTMEATALPGDIIAFSFEIIRHFADGVPDQTMTVITNSSFAQFLGEIDGAIYFRDAKTVFRLTPNGQVDPSFRVVFSGWFDLEALDSCATVGLNNGGVQAVVQNNQLLCWREQCGICVATINTSYRPLVRILVKDAPATEFTFANDLFLGLWASEADGAATVKVHRLGNLGSAASVHYQTLDGTAHAGEHYLAVNGMLDFRPMEKAKSIVVPLVKDMTFKGTPHFFIQLSEPSTMSPFLTTARVTILDSQDGLTIDAPFHRLDGSTHIPYSISGSLGLNALEASRDLKTWNQISEVGGIEIAPGDSHRFYRLRRSLNN